MLTPQTYINTLHAFTVTELDALIEESPVSIRDFIRAVEAEVSQSDTPPLTMRHIIVRLCLLTSVHIGGAEIYIPLPRDRKRRQDFPANLTRLTLQSNLVTLDDIYQLTDKVPAKNATKWPELIYSLIELLQSEAHQMTFSAADKKRVIHALTHCLLVMFSGRHCYMPSASRVVDALRRWMICREFKGNNVRELAYRHDVTVSAVYGFIRRLKKV